MAETIDLTQIPEVGQPTTKPIPTFDEPAAKPTPSFNEPAKPILSSDEPAAKPSPACEEPEVKTVLAFGEPNPVPKPWQGTIEQGVMQMSMLAIVYKKRNVSEQELQRRTADVKSFLQHLETLPPKPELKTRYKLDKALELLSQNSKFTDVLPGEIVTTAARLLLKFNDANWGESNQPLQAPQNPPVPPSGSTSLPRRSRPTHNLSQSDAKDPVSPPPNHPIWGIHGIMHGLARKNPSDPKSPLAIDRKYEHEKRDAKRIGHNGLSPGDWWPYQMAALFAGAHGHTVRGITGSAQAGAYSIVISGSSQHYSNMNEDKGETVYYSADNSHDNTNPLRVDYISNATQGLHTSLRTAQPVRVLRSHGNSIYAPSCGIRYDGLYRVTKVLQKENQKGGLYEQFVLQRCVGQRELQDIVANVPSRMQKRLFSEIGGY
ncbi:E3 ubiquitin-protein ligase UHRF1 [Diplogelasinospora grovesii]|uniref:E3 ubiquitin-protein ligase UHRF1 n=1 Tax=Diplogelasinospora grovesii TaxID=303347 RepID=A0AAN6S2A2_9PEZI|nr:E3 ubiquitin-protein ligase UHRF1 [Diplogelasinospora grovesii]